MESERRKSSRSQTRLAVMTHAIMCSKTTGKRNEKMKFTQWTGKAELEQRNLAVGEAFVCSYNLVYFSLKWEPATVLGTLSRKRNRVMLSLLRFVIVNVSSRLSNRREYILFLPDYPLSTHLKLTHSCRSAVSRQWWWIGTQKSQRKALPLSGSTAWCPTITEKQNIEQADRQTNHPHSSTLTPHKWT